ncbi:hypothetical protein SLE2022_294120 [Rubroshorea leprosula]
MAYRFMLNSQFHNVESLDEEDSVNLRSSPMVVFRPNFMPILEETCRDIKRLKQIVSFPESIKHNSFNMDTSITRSNSIGSFNNVLSINFQDRICTYRGGTLLLKLLMRQLLP